MSDTKFSVNNPLGVTVSCSNYRWDNHILEHEIMKDNVDAVKDTIKHPDTIYKSDQNDEREVYFKQSSFSTYNAKTKVIVEYSSGKKNPDTKVGNVVTAFPQKEEKGGIGDVVYKNKTED